MLDRKFTPIVKKEDSSRKTISSKECDGFIVVRAKGNKRKQDSCEIALRHFFTKTGITPPKRVSFSSMEWEGKLYQFLHLFPEDEGFKLREDDLEVRERPLIEGILRLEDIDLPNPNEQVQILFHLEKVKFETGVYELLFNKEIRRSSK